MIVYEVDYIGSLLAAYDVRVAEQLFPQAGQVDLQANWGITSEAVDVLLRINAVHLYPREEELRSGVQLLHSCVSGNYLLTGTMMAGSAAVPTGLPIRHGSSNIAPVANVALMLATTRVVPADQPSGASVGVIPQRRAAPAVSAATSRQSYGLLQAKSLSRARAKMLPKGASSRAKT